MNLRMLSVIIGASLISATAFAEEPTVPPNSPFVPYQMDWAKMQPIVTKAQSAMQTQLQFGSKTWVEASTVNDILGILQGQENEAALAAANAKADEKTPKRDEKK